MDGRKRSIRNPAFINWNRLRRFDPSVIPEGACPGMLEAGAGIQVFKWNRLRRSLNSYSAARRAAAGFSSLFAQRREARRKRARRRLNFPCASRPGRALAELAGRTQRASGSTPDSRNLPAGAATLGGGYGVNVNTNSNIRRNSYCELRHPTACLLCVGWISAERVIHRST